MYCVNGPRNSSSDHSGPWRVRFEVVRDWTERTLTLQSSLDSRQVLNKIYTADLLRIPMRTGRVTALLESESISDVHRLVV